MAIATAVAVAATVATTAYSISAKKKASKAAQGSAEQNEAYIREQQGVDAEATGIRLLQQQRDAYKAQGATKAGYTASGVRLQGSALDALAEGTRNEALDAKLIEKQGQLNQLALETQVQQQASEAAAAKSAGNAAVVGGALSAASDLATNINWG